MVRMEMSDKEVCSSQIHSEFPQARLHGHQALLLIPSRVDKQMPFRTPDYIGVEGFQGALGKRNFDFIKIWGNFFNH